MKAPRAAVGKPAHKVGLPEPSSEGRWGYPALRLPDRSDFAAFFSAAFLPSIGSSISFWLAAALRGFLPFAGASLARLFFNASIRSTTFSPRGRGLGPIVLPC